MSSIPPGNQLPPLVASFSFPPDNIKSGSFNSIDSFVTSWVTPASSSNPCFLSLHFWNGSNPDAPWRSSFNKTVPLNGTTIVPLNCVAHGLARLSLNYVDPLGSHQLASGVIFGIDYNPTQPKAETWNADALSSLTSSATASSPQSFATSSARTPAPAPPTTLASSMSSVAPHVSTSTTTPSPPPTTASDSNSGNARVASIVLGVLLAILIIALLAAFLLRRHRRKTQRRLEVRTLPSAVTEQAYTTGHELCEIDGAIAVNEIGDRDRPWELAAHER